jgi:phytoene dehydrogenase-like protein
MTAEETGTAHPVVVVGAGLAGLTAGAVAARAGAPVIILDAVSPGGRARTEDVDGFRFNRGPHALYRGGTGRRVLDGLGIRLAMHTPPLPGSRVLLGGRPYPVLSRRVLGGRTAARLAIAFARAARTDPARHAGQSAREWIASLGAGPHGETVLATLVRVTSYVSDLDRMSADVAIGQLRLGVRGVGYPDEGWQALVAALLARASEAGAELRPGGPVTRVEGEPGAWQVCLLSGERITASAVVIAAGTPAAARRLLPADPAWGDLGPEVTAACLDLGVKHTRTRFAIGLDEPLYLSPHAPPGHLAPTGRGLVHVMRYGARTAADDRAQLRAVARACGIGDADIAAERFLPRMVVVTSLPAPGTGLAGRPPAAVPGMPGIFVAGDWVGPRGWLSDCSLASGEDAGQLAARHARSGHPAGARTG